MRVTTETRVVFPVRIQRRRMMGNIFTSVLILFSVLLFRNLRKRIFFHNSEEKDRSFNIPPNSNKTRDPNHLLQAVKPTQSLLLTPPSVLLNNLSWLMENTLLDFVSSHCQSGVHEAISCTAAVNPSQSRLTKPTSRYTEVQQLMFVLKTS